MGVGQGRDGPGRAQPGPSPRKVYFPIFFFKNILHSHIFPSHSKDSFLKALMESDSPKNLNGL